MACERNRKEMNQARRPKRLCRSVLNSPGWKIGRTGASRGAARSADAALPGLRADFLTEASLVADEVILEPASRTRGADAGTGALDLTCDLRAGHTAMLAIRLPSGALTFHRPLQVNSRSAAGPSKARFQVEITRPATRGLVGQVVKAIVIEVAKIGLDKGVSLALPKLAEAFEKAAWKKLGLKEGWVRVTKDTLATGALEAAKPASPERSLLFIHGTFTNAATEFCALADSTLFERVAGHVRRSDLRVQPFQCQPNARAERPDAAGGPARQDDDVRCRRAFPRRPGPSQFGRAFGAPRTTRAPFQTWSRGPRGMSERRDAVGDTEALGRHGRMDCQPPRNAAR